MLAGLRSGTSKSPGAGQKVQLLCFNPVSLKARADTLESKSSIPVAGKWRKHPAKESNFFCLEVLRWLTLFPSHYSLCLSSFPVRGCYSCACGLLSDASFPPVIPAWWGLYPRQPEMHWSPLVIKAFRAQERTPSPGRHPAPCLGYRAELLSLPAQFTSHGNK